ncbi:poly [ADP-ribose] polymerase 2-A-like [Pyrus ussuriensis x Pyrus communis]|uniref:Poly [ADP-ribose] polymerase n=1 Tax=Pyrus ussuriensis x Pyrus communis TaxID=2448454 RepID=A0A5N5FPP4_9ROSA|nr:poly [ADP-ribose] polymerase 2-A-like [Pyrus ussuriensis x Pyrus communis]
MVQQQKLHWLIEREEGSQVKRWEAGLNWVRENEGHRNVCASLLRDCTAHVCASLFLHWTLPSMADNTEGVGGTEPDFSEAQLLDDGVVVPLGKPKENTSRPKGSLLYNEYIVYNVEQIRMRYVVQVNFNFKMRLASGCIEQDEISVLVMYILPSSFIYLCLW